MSKFPHYKQTESKDCGPTCIKIVAKYYGKNIHVQSLRNYSETTFEGSSLLGLSEAAEKIGFHSLGVKINFKKLQQKSINGGDGTCAYIAYIGDGTYFMEWNVSQAVATSGISRTGSAKNKWCCDSCSSATWLGGIM